MMEETRLLWPEIQHPHTVRRSISVLLGSQAVWIGSVELIIIVNHEVYIVCTDSGRLRPGQVLFRRDFSQSVFEVVENLNLARRELSSLQTQSPVTDPSSSVQEALTAPWLLSTLWTLRPASSAEGVPFIWWASDDVRLTPPRLDDPEADWERRLQERRGIGRTQGWRVVALESLIDQLRSLCRRVRHVALVVFQSQDIFGPHRHQKKIRHVAMQMTDFANTLRPFYLRPFHSTYVQLVRELHEAARYLHEAAHTAQSEPFAHARLRLSRVAQAAQLLEQQWRLEEWLLRTRLPAFDTHTCLAELNEIFHILTEKDPITKQPVDEGFRSDILPMVRGHLQLSIATLEQRSSLLSGRFYTHLKAACQLP